MFRTIQLSANRPIWCMAICSARLAHLHHGRRRQENYYEVLNVPKNSSSQDIRKAFITLSKKYHPDANTQTRDPEQFVRVCEAYQVLQKESLRNQYDSTSQYLYTPKFNTSCAGSDIKKWTDYRGDIRKKQMGLSLKINRSSAMVRPKPWPIKPNQPSRWLPVVVKPPCELPVIESPCQHFCGSAAICKSKESEEYETEPPTGLSYSCYIAGFGLLSGLLFMDSLGDWCKEKSSDPSGDTSDSA